MSIQQNIRFPEDLHAAISTEAERRGKPWTFSSVLVEWAERGGACQDLTFCLAKPAKDSQTYARSLVREANEAIRRLAPVATVPGPTMTDLNIYTVSMGYGLYVVRAIDEDDARAVAHAGPSLDKYTHAASQYCAEFDPDAAVQLVAPGGRRGVVDSHYG